MRIRGKTRVELILIHDYRLFFDGPVTRKYVTGVAARTNIPIEYDRERLDLILVPEVLDETNFVHDYAILDRLKRGLPILRPEVEIGTRPVPKLSDKGAARLATCALEKGAAKRSLNSISSNASSVMFPTSCANFQPHANSCCRTTG